MPALVTLVEQKVVVSHIPKILTRFSLASQKSAVFTPDSSIRTST